jgi:spore maturation protein CgeB
MNLFARNLKLLESVDPSLASRVEASVSADSIEVQQAKDGSSIPKIGGVCLHSAYHPKDEAEKSVAPFEPIAGKNTIVYGLGFAFHIQALLQKDVGKITVIEPSMALFQALMTHVEIEPLLANVRFVVGQSPEKVLTLCGPTSQWNVFEHKPSVRINGPYFDGLTRVLSAQAFLGETALRILVVNPIYGGSLPTAHYCAEALENLGHTVSSVQCEDFADGFHALKNITSDKTNRNVLDGLFINLMGQAILAKTVEFQPDLILVLAQAPVDSQTIRSLKKMNIPLAFWFVEDFRTLTYWKEVAPLYDHFFSIQRGELEKINTPDYYYLPQACHPQVHRPLSEADSGVDSNLESYRADLSFMGAAYFNRQQSFPQLVDYDFKIWGTEWNLDTDIGKRVQNENKRLSSEEIVKIYNSGTINLNLHSSTCHSELNPKGDFVNPRTFEIPACGGFQLVDHRSELAEMLRIGDEIETFHSIAELKEKIDHYLQHPEERKRMAQRARARVLAEHTIEQRMSEMLIHIVSLRLEQMTARTANRKDPVDRVIEQAGTQSELGTFLQQFRGTPDFSLKTVMDSIEKGQGDLSKNEILFLMLDQVTTQKN